MGLYCTHLWVKNDSTIISRSFGYKNHDQCPEFLGDPVSTDAILDCIFHHSVIVRVYGPSYRKYQSELLQKKYAENKTEK